MKQFDRTNTGTLGRNTRKEKDSHPDFTGQININGVDYWLSGWTKTAGPQAAKPGSKFLSLSVTPKDGLAEPRKPAPGGGQQSPQKPRQEAPGQWQETPDPFDDDDIPF
jgi:hypothetical protein